ncbi:NADH-quinone oxidoreductase subunit N [Pseudochryseolinea flava]|uniref:NADH-quinone oxidoreductase subunit N n=1 Tax=Pseudochryseolinea flava TaxID=2059302 RepID=A0A364Y0J9_9BACT|nr:NADH-quinone oxidoreductase subunit N [Pseudochryseolinea flava]RAW00314.1 NADH-quinone oxidoreductase subunit N [Pseudochryseolinea flava]
MNRSDLYSLTPLLILSSAAILNFFSISIKRNHKVIFAITVLSLIGDFIFLTSYSLYHQQHIDPLLVVDGFGIFNIGLILLTTLVVALMSYAYFEQREERKEEYYILLILAALGACIMVISKHFVSFFLGLEVLSVSLYSLIAYLRTRERSDEAGIKYLILAAFSSAFLLFGMSLIYATTGKMDFGGIGYYLTTTQDIPLIMMAGLGMLIVGAGFKLGVVPFHMWTPDVYEGAPTPVTAFIATVSKGGMIALLVRFFNAINGYQYESFTNLFTVLSIASMFVGNILALRQTNLKRILAYSSISHIGYLLVAFLSGGSMGAQATTFYLVAYFITTLGAFGIIATLSDQHRDAELIDDYRGLLWRRPLTAVAFSAMLLSLAGIPLTAGFIAKFYVITAGIGTQHWLLVFCLVVNSVIGLYYYIKIIAVMFDQKLQIKSAKELHPLVYVISSVTIAVLAVFLFWLGVSPEGMLSLIDDVI